MTNPFPGLRSFELKESDRFFGRDLQIEDILTKLKQNQFISVLGTSGSGKSSLVKGGVLPRLARSEEEHWEIHVMRPESQPIQNLAKELAKLGRLDIAKEDAEEYIMARLLRSRLGLVEVIEEMELEPWEHLLIVVDQFEELFRYQKEEATLKVEDSNAAKFVNLLLEATSQSKVPAYVMITMRSDFLSDCTAFYGLPEAINGGQYLIPRMTRTELKQVITGPLDRFGYPISNVLVNRLLYDLGDNMDQLPILQHALMRTWSYWHDKAQEGDPIGLDHYEAIGTMSDALSGHADEAYFELDQSQQKLCEGVFQALTEIGDGDRGIRRPTSIAQLAKVLNCDPEDIIRAVHPFRIPGRGFLVPQEGLLHDDSVLDISHESLMRVWQRLIDWAKDEHANKGIYLRLMNAAKLYQSNQAGLYQGPELEFALRWFHNNKVTEAWGERYHPAYVLSIEFLKLSEDEAHRQLRLQEKRRKHRTRLIAIAAVFMTGALIVSVVLGLQANSALKEAERQRLEADTQRQLATENEEAAQESAAEALAEKQLAEAAKQDALESRNEAEQNATEAQIQRGLAYQNQIVALASAEEAKRQADSAQAAKQEADAQREIALANEQQARSLAAHAQSQSNVNEAIAKSGRALYLISDDPAEAKELAINAADTLYKYQTLPLVQQNTLYQALVALWQQKQDKYMRNFPYDIKAMSLRNNNMLLVNAKGELGTMGINPNRIQFGDYRRISIAGSVLGAEWVSGEEAIVWTREGHLLVYDYRQQRARLYPNPGGIKRPISVMAAEGPFMVLEGESTLKVCRYGPDSLQTLGEISLPVGTSASQVEILPLSDDQLQVVTLSETGLLIGWILTPGTRARNDYQYSINLHGQKANCLAIHPTGRWVGIGVGKEIQLLNTQTGAGPSPFGGHTARITDLTFSKSNDLVQLASTSLDNTVRLWPLYGVNQPTTDAYWTEEPLVIETKGTWINTAQFVANDQLMLIGGTEGLLRWAPTQIKWLTENLTQ